MKRVMCLLALLALPFAASAAGAPPSSSRLAPVLAAKDWINGRVTASDLDGKVVVVDIFTFNCINCKHVLPNLQHLHAALPAGDLAIIGVHAPETAEERDRSNVVRELARQGVVWPVAVDENFTIWHALDNEYWPTQYIFDRHGVLRRTVVGEGQDELVDATVKTLIAEH